MFLNKQSRLSLVVEKLLGILVLLFIVCPILILVLTAFKSERDTLSTLFRFAPTLENYRNIFGDTLRVHHSFVNSLIVATATILIVMPIAVMSAFAFSRIRFRMSNIILTYILACQFLPPVVMALPYFNFMRSMGLVDTHIALILVNLSTALPYAIWILQGYVDALPAEIEEAAYVDGCNRFQTLARITVPLIMPGIITAAVMVFIVAWNEFLFALIMSSTNTRTMTVALNLANSAEGLRWGWMSAIATLVIIPVFCLALPIRNNFVQGLTMGSDR